LRLHQSIIAAIPASIQQTPYSRIQNSSQITLNNPYFS